MSKVKNWCAALAAVLLAACGGGGGYGGDNGGGGGGTPPPTTGAPTASLQASNASATSLVSTAKTSAAALAKAGGLNGVPFLGLIVSPPTGITQSGSENCANSGSIAFTYTIADQNGNITAGDRLSIVATNCSQVAGQVVNGSLAIVFTRYASASDFAWDITATNLSATYGGVTYGPYSFQAHYDLHNGVVAYTYTIDGTTVVSRPTVLYSGVNVTITSGTVRSNYGDGWVEIAYSNWQYNSETGRPTSGTITITASNGNSAVITVTDTGYNVAITVGGSTTSYVVPFS